MNFDFKDIVSSLSGEKGIELDTVLKLLSSKKLSIENIGKLKDIFMDIVAVVKLPEVDKLLDVLNKSDEEADKTEAVKSFLVSAKDSDALKSAIIPVLPKILSLFNDSDNKDEK